MLQEYVTEGATMYEQLLANARRSTVYSLFAYEPTPAQVPAPEQIAV